MIKIAAVSIFSSVATSRFATNITMPKAVPTFRFGTVEGFLLADYLNYDCWCSLNQIPTGKGAPVNEIDSLCRSL